MTDSRIFGLVSEQARKNCAHFAMTGPEGWFAKFSAPTRTLEQNAKFHALCDDLAKSDVTWAGKRRTAAQWKVLLVSGHAVATKEGSEILPGIEGEFVNIRESTALMSKKRGASLIEYTLAFCAMHGVSMREECAA
jgi:hypothetical protein